MCRNSLDERFWQKVKKTPGCWEWTAAKNWAGYGKFSIRRSVWRSAHRVAYEITHGVTLKADQVLAHSCDNPACVRPSHLSLGTHADNIADKVRKGRQPRGDGIGTAKLSQVAALAVRASRGEPSQAFLRQYGVSRAQVYRIRKGERWAHLSGDVS